MISSLVLQCIMLALTAAFFGLGVALRRMRKRSEAYHAASLTRISHLFGYERKARRLRRR